MIGQFLAERFLDGVQIAGLVSLFGFGVSGAINLLKSFGGIH